MDSLRSLVALLTLLTLLLVLTLRLAFAILPKATASEQEVVYFSDLLLACQAHLMFQLAILV